MLPTNSPQGGLKHTFHCVFAQGRQLALYLTEATKQECTAAYIHVFIWSLLESFTKYLVSICCWTQGSAQFLKSCQKVSNSSVLFVLLEWGSLLLKKGRRGDSEKVGVSEDEAPSWWQPTACVQTVWITRDPALHYEHYLHWPNDPPTSQLVRRGTGVQAKICHRVCHHSITS